MQKNRASAAFKEQNDRFTYTMPLALRQIVIRMMIRAMTLKMSIRLCFAWAFTIFFDVVLASVMSTTAISIDVLCSIRQ